MPFLKKTALIEDLSDNQFLQRYTFTREDGAEGSIELRPAEADKWTTFRDQLRNRNAHLSLLNKPIIEAAAASDPESDSHTLPPQVGAPAIRRLCWQIGPSEPTRRTSAACRLARIGRDREVHPKIGSSRSDCLAGNRRASC